LFGFLFWTSSIVNKVWDILWMEYNFNLFDFNHFWWFDILVHYTIVCTLYVFLCIVLILHFCCMEMLGLDSYFHYKWKDHIGLDMIYHSRYFHVMFCMCGDNNSYGCWHRNAQQKTWVICEVMVKVLSPIMTGYVLNQTHIQFVITKTHARFDMNLFMWLSLTTWLI
jgi:hypothetical protein